MINFAGIYNNRYNMKYGFVRVAACHSDSESG
jgi:NAD+ synthase (glutamine-hydrolysing)